MSIRVITPEQIRAARALLNLKQSELAKTANISLASLNNIERQVTQPRVDTLKKIQLALEESGVEFLPHDGLRRHQESFKVDIVEGKEAVKKWLNDIIETIEKHGGEVLLIGIDDREFVKRDEPSLANYCKLQAEREWVEKILLCEGDDFFYTSNVTTEYRWISKEVFSQTPYAVYGDSYSIITWGPPERVIIIKNQAIADSARRQFMHHWNSAQVIKKTP